MIDFREITQDNFKECIKLKLKEGQNKFVASNLYSLAQAGVWKEAEPFVIYAGETMVGFIMYCFDEKEKSGDLWRLMVAGEFQGMGYGKQALQKMIEHFKTIKDCRKIFLSYVPGNESAEKLYRFVGFKANGDIDNGEIVMEMKI